MAKFPLTPQRWFYSSFYLNLLLTFQKAIMGIVTIKLLASLTDLENACSLSPMIFLEITFYDKLVAIVNNLGGTDNPFLFCFSDNGI